MTFDSHAHSSDPATQPVMQTAQIGGQIIYKQVPVYGAHGEVVYQLVPLQQVTTTPVAHQSVPVLEEDGNISYKDMEVQQVEEPPVPFMMESPAPHEDSLTVNQDAAPVEAYAMETPAESEIEKAQKMLVHTHNLRENKKLAVEEMDDFHAPELAILGTGYDGKSTVEVEKRLKKQQGTSVALSLGISFLAVILLGVILALLAIAIPSKEVDTIISYQAPRVEEVSETQKKMVNTQRSQPTPPAASAAVANVITSTSVSNLSVPSTDSVSVESLDFGEMDDFGAGFGEDFGSGFGGEGAGEMTLFGRVGGDGIKGVLYDLKKDADGELNEQGKYYRAGAGGGDLTPIVKVYYDLSKKGFEQKYLQDFYRAKQELSFTYLGMDPNTRAAKGPESFKVQDEVEPSGWLVVYQGKLDPEEPGYYQFCGTFDDVLLVYIDGKLVLDGSYGPYSAFRRKNKKGLEMRPRVPLGEGSWVKIKKGSEIIIALGECPGGFMGGGLFIKKKGEKYDQDSAGGDILPPFTTIELGDEDKERMRTLPIVGGGIFPVDLENVPIFHPYK